VSINRLKKEYITWVNFEEVLDVWFVMLEIFNMSQQEENFSQLFMKTDFSFPKSFAKIWLAKQSQPIIIR
jgi:hypothetical protein